METKVVAEEVEVPNQEAFQPGKIHDKKHFQFWKDVLGASPWVLATLEHGYKIPFASWPPVYEEQNNATARARPEVIREIIEEMIELKIVKVVEVKPRCVSPLGLVTKLQSDGTEKHRVVFDASRCVNLHLEKLKVTLSHLDKALELTEEGEYQSIFDLASCYYHIKIFEAHQTYLGAAYYNAEGKKVYFVYKHLPFGLASAVHVVTKIMKPILAFVHQRGIKLSIYIDDGRFLAADMEAANKARELVYDTLVQAGWQISLKKSDKKDDASCVKEYLGFIIDSLKMEVRISEEKMQKMETILQKALSLRSMEIRKFAKVQGKIVALIPSHGFLAKVCSRSGYCQIERHVSEFGWKGHIYIEQNTRDEWELFLGSLRQDNGAPIKSQLNEYKVSTIIENPITKQERVTRIKNKEELVMVSDASAVRVVAYDLLDAKREVLNVLFSTEEMSFSSGLRELLAVEKTVSRWAITGEVTNKHVFWCTDSANTVSFLTKGSSKSHVQKVVFSIAKKLQKLRILISPIHLSRMDPRIQEADERSKQPDSDDWSIDKLSFEDLDNQFHFDVDLFASTHNARLDKFYSLFYEEKSQGMDAFAQDWSSGMLWMAPPVKLLTQVVRRIKKCHCQGVVILPKWPTALFYVHFFDGDKARYPFILVREFNPFIFQNQDASSALKGKVEFNMVALYFKT